LGVTKKPGKGRGKALIGLLIAAVAMGSILHAEAAQPLSPSAEAAGFPGMDEAVNEKISEDAGVKPRDPYINLEAMGDLWNFVLLLGGGAAGFVVGRYWHLLFERKKRK
jgi:hypothetical protein